MDQALRLNRRAVLFINGRARRGQESLEMITKRFQDAGISVSVEPFKGTKELREDCERLKSDTDFFVLCGGDGTIRSSAAAIVEAGLPLGIMPMGTANDLARTLGIPADLEKAADIIIAGHTQKIDLGSVNDHYFFNVASIGISADLAKNLTGKVKKRWGRLGYAFAAIKVLLNARPFGAEIIGSNCSASVRTYQIAVGNGRHYGGGNVIEANARIDDGKLDLYSLEIGSVWKLAFMARKFRNGKHGAMNEVRTERCEEFDIRTRKPRSINLDGELLTQTPAHFKVHPQAITVFVPQQPLP